MYKDHKIAVIIPALNEAESIGKVLETIPDWVDDVVVANNGSTDHTAQVAMDHGARVVNEPQRGYGAACLKGVAALHTPDIVVFLDADFSDHPEEMHLLVDPIIDDAQAMVIGSRMTGLRERGALTPQARFGNWLATKLIKRIWGLRFTDLGPFRAIRYDTLQSLRMRDRDYGWTVEMQIKAAQRGFPATEVPVQYRKRIGQSKVSGTLRGIVGAGYKILGLILVNACKREQTSETLVVFTRYPKPGKTKTRMIPTLGKNGAANLQRAMTEHTLKQAEALGREIQIEVRYAGGSKRKMRRWLGKKFKYTSQNGGTLGQRMGTAFWNNLITQKQQAVVIVGSDCPEMTTADMQAAFDALIDHELVIGPASDGGYYLIGLQFDALKKLLPARMELHLKNTALFDAVDWGSDSVLEQTITNANALRLRMKLLRQRDDVDRPEDLAVWERVLHSSL